MSVQDKSNSIRNDDTRQSKPDFIIKIRTEERTQKSGKYGFYVVGAAWVSDHGSIYLDINFPNPFMVDPQTKIILIPNQDKEE